MIFLSELIKYKRFDEFEIWKYTPDLLHPFLFDMEPLTWSHRVRCVFEYFTGYSVYYIKINGEWAGYCVVSGGNNPRYKFSTPEDIIYGRYFIAEKFRGDHLAVKMLEKILNECDLTYKRAYAYLLVTNIASMKTLQRIGAVEIQRFDIRGLLRNKLIPNPEGEFALYEYKKEYAEH